MEICPVDRSWIHTYVLESYLEGVELINKAWNGVDWSLERNHLSLTDRIISWIQGVILIIPLVNTIVWFAWQIFGKPDKMSASFCPEIDAPSVTMPPAPEIIIHPNTNGREGEREQFGYIETTDNRPIRTSWLVEKFPDVIVTTQNANEFSSSSVYRRDYSLKELHYQAGSKRIDLSMNNSSQVLVQISENAETTTQKLLNIPNDGRPWIQQRAIGLKPFVLSPDQEIEFYSIIPEYPTLIGWVLSWGVLKATPFVAKVKATKGQIEDGLLKVEISSLDGWPYSTVRSELWFDPATGSLRRFIDSGTYISRKVGTFVQNNPLPE